MKPLDFVRTPQGALALVKEVLEDELGNRSASVSFIGGGHPTKERNAWWRSGDLEIVDNLPQLLSREMSHPFGNGHLVAKTSFPIP